MKRTRWTMETAALMAWLMMSAVLIAQQPGGASAKQADAPSSDEPEEGTGSARKPETEEGQARRMISVLTKLREKMESKLDLSDEQKRSIRGLFEDHLKTLKATATAKKASAGEKGEKGDELGELRTKLKEAEKNGDKDTVNDLRKQMREMRRERRTGLNKGTSQFLKKVEEKLDDEQKEPFEEMVKEFGLDLESETSEVSVQQLFRAALNPEVGLDQQQKAVVIQRMRASIESMDADTKDSRDLDEISGQLRADLRKEMSPEQWNKVEELLKADIESKKSSDRRNEGRKPAGEKSGAKDD